jgi:hypothetical protein
MPQPTQGDLYVDALLTNVAVKYLQEAVDFVAGKVFPVIGVEQQAGLYPVYDRSFWYRNGMAKRAPGTRARSGGWEVDNTNTYYCDEYAEKVPIADPDRANASSVYDLNADATEFLALQAKLNSEILWAAEFFTTGLWTTDATPGTLWDASGGDPITDVDAAKDTVKALTGYDPNTLVLGRKTFHGIKNNALVRDRTKYTSPDSVTPAMLAALLGVDQVLVAASVYNTANEGQTASYSFVAGSNDALLCYAAPSPSKKMPSAGYTFAWTGRPGAGPQGQRIKTYREEDVESDIIEIQQNFDQKLIAADLGYFFSNAVA